jgi:phytoene dehydrogenase-like protein
MATNANHYDAILIGGGHNGLIAAAYLAKHGARTVVLEKRHKTGGAADTMEPWPDELPGVKVTTLSYVMSLMPPSIQRDLQLERFGYKIHTQGMGYLPVPGGGSIIQSDDQERGSPRGTQTRTSGSRSGSAASRTSSARC